jgi:hypothetical protein
MHLARMDQAPAVAKPVRVDTTVAFGGGPDTLDAVSDN